MLFWLSRSGRRGLIVCTCKSPLIVNYYCVTNSLEALQLEMTILIAYDSLGVAWGLSQGQALSRCAETWWPRIASFACVVVETGSQLPFLPGGHSFTQWSQGSKKAREDSEASWGLGSEIPRVILPQSVSQSLSSPDSGVKEIDSTSWWEERQSLCRQVHGGLRGSSQPPLLTIHLRFSANGSCTIFKQQRLRTVVLQLSIWVGDFEYKRSWLGVGRVLMKWIRDVLAFWWKDQQITQRWA